jgi:diaminopimelate epimerase
MTPDPRPTAAPSTVRAAKYQGLGNDFLVALLPEVPGDAAALARRVCARRTGVGADGLIVGTPSSRPDVDLVLHLWNADGSSAEISGNGIRCLAHAEARRRGVDSLDLVVETPAGDRALQVRPGGHRDQVVASVSMGSAKPGPVVDALPPAPTVTPRRTATVDLGNPHVVVLVDDPDAVDVGLAGPRIEAAFPGGINVHFVAPTDGGGLRLRVWERGAGVTEACGSGAAASAFAAHEWGLAAGRVRVSMPGGDAEVVIGDELTLIGPSEFIADVQIPNRADIDTTHEVVPRG